MSRLEIDFAANSRRGPSLAALALLLAGAVWLMQVWLELDDLDQQSTVAEARLRSLARTTMSAAGLKSDRSSATDKDPARTGASEALARLQAPWPDLLEHLEAMADLPVAVLDLDAEASGRTLRLAAEAKNMADTLAFVERLRQGRRFDEVHLQGHEVRKVGAVEVIAFTVQATWPRTRDATRDAAR